MCYFSECQIKLRSFRSLRFDYDLKALFIDKSFLNCMNFPYLVKQWFIINNYQDLPPGFGDLVGTIWYLPKFLHIARYIIYNHQVAKIVMLYY